MIDRQYKAFGGAEKAEYPRSTPGGAGVGGAGVGGAGVGGAGVVGTTVKHATGFGDGRGREVKGSATSPWSARPTQHSDSVMYSKTLQVGRLMRASQAVEWGCNTQRECVGLSRSLQSVRPSLGFQGVISF